jgi:hypothetical protein
MTITIQKGKSTGSHWILNDGEIIGSIRSIDYEGNIQRNKLGYEVRIYTKPFGEVDVFKDDYNVITKVLFSGTLQKCKKYALENL